MPWLGLLILFLTVVLLSRRYEVRLVLLGSGLVLASLAGQPMLFLDTFARPWSRDWWPPSASPWALPPRSPCRGATGTWCWPYRARRLNKSSFELELESLA